MCRIKQITGLPIAKVPYIMGCPVSSLCIVGKTDYLVNTLHYRGRNKAWEKGIANYNRIAGISSILTAG